MVDYGKRLNRQLKELNGGSKKKAAELAKEIKTLSAESTALFQTGQRNISDGFESLRLALQTDATHPVVLEVASLYYSISKDNLSESKDLAHEGLVHRGLDPETFDWKQPPSPWSGIAMSEVQAGLESDEQTATAILRSLVQEDPRFHRARFELAQMYMTLERAEMARAEVDAVLALESDHERAAVWIEHLNRSMPGAGDPDAPAVASAQAPNMTEETAGGEAVADSDDSKKKKKKRPRKKRRRKKR
ncbi:MAG: tetratricopeptide repeat protein [Myxococcota bacterium]